MKYSVGNPGQILRLRIDKFTLFFDFVNYIQLKTTIRIFNICAIYTEEKFEDT